MKGLCLLALAILQAGEFEVEPRRVEWSELSPGHFNLAWRLPSKRRAGGRDVLAEMERLSVLKFVAKDTEGQVYRTLGELALAIRKEQDPSTWLDKLLMSSPKLQADWGPAIRQLLLDGDLRQADWDPEEDSGLDGLLTGASWDLSKEGAPWNGLEVQPLAQQGAVVIRANLATIKAAEHDFRSYTEIPGANYEEIYPVDGSYFRGEDPTGKGYSALRLYFRSELPLWYPDYRCELRMLNRIDSLGRLVCDIYSVSSDFHWLAGRDVYLPLEVSEASGGRAAYLVVRQYGFDLDGVPDGEDDVLVALRQSLGSLKRNAEALAGLRSSARADRGPARVPEYRVRGQR